MKQIIMKTIFGFRKEERREKVNVTWNNTE
jgi:hypothetical protein